MQVKYKDDNSLLHSSWRGIKGKSRMVLVEKIFVSDNIIAEVWDQSRVIASNTTRVDILFRIKFDLMPSYFDNMEHFEQVRKVYGTQIFHEYRMGKSFVTHSEKSAVVEILLESFKNNSLPYLSKPTFPRHLVLSKYMDIINNCP